MENKVKFGDYEFTLKDNKLGVVNAFTPLLAKLTALEEQYLGYLDTKEYDEKVKVIRQLEKAMSQIKEDDTKKELYEKYEKSLNEKLTELEEDYAPLIERINQFKGFARQEWITDVESFKEPIKKLIITGDYKKINWQSDNILTFITDCVNFFYSVMGQTKQ